MHSKLSQTSNHSNPSNKSLKLVKTLSFLLGITILVIFIYSLINYTFLKNQINETLGNQIEVYGYAGVFFLSFILEISPQPFASAIIPFTNGLILGLNFEFLLLITILAVIVSSFTAYILGHIYGKRIILRLIRQNTYEKYNTLFKKYGKLGMTLIALTPLPYFPILAGLFKMNLKDFILFALIPRVFYFIIFGYIVNLFI